MWDAIKIIQFFNPYPAKLIYLNFHPLEVVSHYREPQLEVDGNYSHLFNLSSNIRNSSCLDTHFIPNNSALVIKQIKNTVQALKYPSAHAVTLYMPGFKAIN